MNVEGRWAGTRIVLRFTDANTRKVTCDIVGEGSPQRMSIGGTCGVAIVSTRAVDANLAVGENGYVERDQHDWTRDVRVTLNFEVP